MSLVDKILPQNWDGSRRTFIKFALVGALAISANNANANDLEYKLSDGKEIEGLSLLDGSYDLIDNKEYTSWTYKNIEFIRPKYDDGFERKMTLALGLGKKSFGLTISGKDTEQERIIDYFNNMGAVLNKLNPGIMEIDQEGMKNLAWIMAKQIEGSNVATDGTKHYSIEMFNEFCNQYNRFYAPILAKIIDSPLSNDKKKELIHKYNGEIQGNRLTMEFDIKAAFKYITNYK